MVHYKQVSLRLEIDIVKELQERGYNISQLVRNFLRKKLEENKE